MTDQHKNMPKKCGLVELMDMALSSAELYGDTNAAILTCADWLESLGTFECLVSAKLLREEVK
jgi:hypothetical protein